MALICCRRLTRISNRLRMLWQTRVSWSRSAPCGSRSSIPEVEVQFGYCNSVNLVKRFTGAHATLVVNGVCGIGSIGILPVGTVGRVGQSVHLLSAHGSGVTDWEFSPFDANVLVTGSENGEVCASTTRPCRMYQSRSLIRLLNAPPLNGSTHGTTGQGLADRSQRQ